MARRKHNPAIPAHIDQARLPKGIYWDASGNGRWYVFEDRDGRKGTKSVAGPCATLADLHGLMEQRTTGCVRGTIRHVVGKWQESPAWAALSPRARKDYAYALKQAMAYRTRSGAPLGDLYVDRLTPPVFARLRDALSATPAKANTWLRRLKGAFAWGVETGHCRTNPCAGVSLLKERKRDGMPVLLDMRAVQAFARDRGQLVPHTAGSLPPWLWAAMELAYQCRLRRIEVLTLTDAHVTDKGVQSNRRKGSRDTLTRNSPALLEALAALQAHRAKAWEGRAVPLKPEDRTLIVGEDGEPLTRHGFSSAWQRMMKAAIDGGVIPPGRRFTAHGIKHRGITDSADKRAGGHKTEAMRQRYDHSLPEFDGPDLGSDLGSEPVTLRK
jgi:integrase